MQKILAFSFFILGLFGFSILYSNNGNTIPSHISQNQNKVTQKTPCSEKSCRKESTQLKKITEKINQLQHHLVLFQSQRQDLRQQLAHAEIMIGQLAKKNRSIKIKIRQQDKTLQKTQRQLQSHQTLLEKQRELLMDQVKAAYMLGKQPYLKIVLNQEDSTVIYRYLKYYQYLNNARLNIINNIKETSHQIMTNLKIIQNDTGKLINAKKQKELQQQQLKEKQSDRKTLLTNLNQHIYTKQQQLEKLLHDKRQLESIIKKLNEEQKYGYAPGKSFQSMQHHLLWPIAKGKIIQKFGQSIAYGRIQSTGILITAPAETQVRAVFPGKVIFANWLRGFGLLVIIQHGKDFMTLYGRNESLYVKAGDTVAAEQPIAIVGNSGGFEQTALYFEIRKNTTPVNPLIWLHG